MILKVTGPWEAYVASTINIDAYSDALVVLGTAGIVVPIVRRWGLNPILGYLGAGAILGPLGLGRLPNRFPSSIGSQLPMPKLSPASPSWVSSSCCF